MYTRVEDGVAGYSEWPWDRLYTPVVGCFVSGRLQQTAFCNLLPQVVGLRGPGIRCWFRMSLDRDIQQRIDEGDPAVRFARLEDGAVVASAAPEPQASGERRVEDLLAVDFGSGQRLDGFPIFLGAPPSFQLDVLFLDLLRRIPDPKARTTFLKELENGEADILEIRARIMGGEEFMDRAPRVSDGVGALITSGLWNRLAATESPADRFRPIRRFRVADYADLPTAEYVAMVYGLFLAREADPVGGAHYGHVADTQGRAAVARELSREAADRGLFFNIVEA